MTVRTTWTGPRELLEQAEQILTELIDPPVDAASLVRDDDASAEPENAPWLLHTYAEEPLSNTAKAMLPSSLAAPVQEVLEERDWVAHALDGLGVVRAGMFTLFGSHDADKLGTDGGLKLQIEANRAFGTGHHPTTFGCLEALTWLADLNPSSVLDIGTGSGVLALGARRLWSSSAIVATDIDPTSVEIAEENSQINGISDVAWGVSAGTQSALISSRAPYDLVFANILAGPLVELSVDINHVLAPDGFLILAGLLDEQEERVLRAYQDLGLTLHHRGGTDRWPALTLKKETTTA